MDLMERMNQTKPATLKSFEPLPAGPYTVQIAKTEVKEENGEVKYNIEMIVKEGEYTGRKMWFSPKVNSTTSDERMGVIVGMIYAFAGVSTSDGKSLTEVLQSANGNWVKLELKYAHNARNPEKPFSNYSKIEVITPF